MNATKSSTILAAAFLAYAFALLFLVVFFSRYPWPQPNPAEAAISIARSHEDRDTDSQTAAIADAPPPNFKAITDIKAKKHAFFAFMQPFVDAQNNRLKKQRVQLMALQTNYQNTQKLSQGERQTLQQWRATFKVDGDSVGSQIAELNLRINVIPAALVLAQAASESAWGTSRFAVEANNYFGQWCFSKGCGLVPNNRPASATHEVARFPNARASVAAYFQNLNTFKAYKSLRELRWALTHSEQPITAKKLLPGLKKYSARGQDYLNDIASIIRQNKLE